MRWTGVAPDPTLPGRSDATSESAGGCGTVDADSLAREKVTAALAIEARWATALYRAPDSEQAVERAAE
jgi:hypothetical protein